VTREYPRAGSTSTALLRALVVALLLVLSGCDRPRDEPAAEGAPSSEESAPADHTDADEMSPAASPESAALDTFAVDTSAIVVHFSRTHGGDVAAAQADPGSIDRAAAAFIASARRSLDCALYEIESDRIADALVAAHRRGVRVRIVAESDYRDNEEARRVVDAGIPVVWDERSALMHDKFIVLDDEAVWTGSYNVTDNCSWRNDNNAIVIRSRELAANYRAELEEMFVDGSFGPRSPSSTPHSLVEVGGASIYSYFSPEDDIPPKLIRFIRVARRSIHLLAFSFTDTTIASELIARRAAGIDVRIVLERRGSTGGGSVLERLRAGGVDVVTDGNRYVMHDKVVIVDSTWTITGSYNFTAAAARSNDENTLIIKSPSVARRYEEEFWRIRTAGSTAGIAAN
jgi:phosphatidylserine/phosphatidylglycerophosphate/cardiolipin synthase-like enzyme